MMFQATTKQSYPILKENFDKKENGSKTALSNHQCLYPSRSSSSILLLVVVASVLIAVPELKC